MPILPQIKKKKIWSDTSTMWENPHPYLVQSRKPKTPPGRVNRSNKQEDYKEKNPKPCLSNDMKQYSRN